MFKNDEEIQRKRVDFISNKKFLSKQASSQINEKLDHIDPRHTKTRSHWGKVEMNSEHISIYSSRLYSYHKHTSV